jgi:hypothetical protein
MKNKRNIIIFVVLSVSILFTLVALVLLMVYDARNNGPDDLSAGKTQQAILDESRTEMAKTQASSETALVTGTVTATQTMTATLTSDITATPTLTLTAFGTSTPTVKPFVTQSPTPDGPTTYKLTVINNSSKYTLTFKINDMQKQIDPGGSKVFWLEAGLYLYAYDSDPIGCFGTGYVTIPDDKTISKECP